MRPLMERTQFEGVVAPLVNPCREDDGLDRDALERNMDRLMRTGISGLYLNGGTGDAANLTQQERLDIAALLVPRLKAAGRLAVVHVGQTSQRLAVALAQQAADLGADAVASIPPRKDWPEVAAYYRALAATGAKVIVYYIPGVTGMTANLDNLRALLDIPGVVGIKMSDWNLFLLRCVKLACPEKVVYSGFDELLLPGLLYGADGCIGTWANLLPGLYEKVFASVRAGQADAVRDVANDFTAFLAQCWRWGVLDAFEELMRARGFAGRCFRRPSAWHPGKVPSDALDDLLRRLRRLEEEARP